MKRKFLPFAALALLAAAQGCVSTSRNEFYLATLDLDDRTKELEYYRITVKGASMNTSTRYQTGFYNADSLHQLFGTVDEPKSDKEVFQVNSDGSLKKVDNQLFTVMYGANADAIAAQIKLNAENDAVGRAFGSLLASASGGELLTAANTAEFEAGQASNSSAKLAAELEALAAKLADPSLDANKTIDGIRSSLVAGAQSSTTSLGASYKFDATKPVDAFKEVNVAYETLKDAQK